MAAVKRTQMDGMARRAALVVRTDVAAGGRLGQGLGRAPIRLGKEVGRGGLSTRLLGAERSEVGDRLAARGHRLSPGGVSNASAEHTRALAEESNRHCPAHAESFQLDMRRVNAQIGLDLLEDVIGEGHILATGVGPKPAGSIRGYENGAVVCKGQEPEERALGRVTIDIPRCGS